MKINIKIKSVLDDDFDIIIDDDHGVNGGSDYDDY
jgi:hypothetical protein